jgi:uroporphyrin-III C-methyltransferase/precorrin-2 dehydrogenase/sirohydrochlorin ferrochelatase
MGVEVAGEIARKLIEAGRAPATPVAIVENGGSDQSRHFKGSLGDLAGLIARARIGAPSIILIGEVAALAAAHDIAALVESAA